MNNFYPLSEWHPQGATLLVWPHRYSDWSSTLEDISKTYLEITRVISSRQTVMIAHYDHEHCALIEEACRNYKCTMEHIIFVQIETDDTWVRDYGPQILKGHEDYQYLDLEFNAWGEQYPYRLDNLFSETLYKNSINQSLCQYHRTPIVIEGGNIDFDDNATLLTNIDCIKRNNAPHNFTSDEIKQQLKEQFSAKRILSVEVPALEGDDTGGHIDTLARFVDNHTIMYAACKDQDNPNYYCLEVLREQLAHMKTASGKAYTLIPLLMPENLNLGQEREYVPASYVNFVFINTAVLVPLYNDEQDIAALNTFRRICPDREIIGIEANHLLKQFGSLHCATLHLPEKVINESRTGSAG